jgi:hypothetical protein
MIFEQKTLRKLTLGVNCLFLAIAACLGFRWLGRTEGNAEEIHARIRTGMPASQVLGLLHTLKAPDGMYAEGITKYGRQFSCIFAKDLPPSGAVESCTLQADDDYCREIEVTFGPGLVVASKRLKPGWWEHRWHKAYRELRDKPYLTLLHKYHYIIVGVIAWVCLSAASLVRRKRAKPSRGAVVSWDDLHLPHRAA